MTTDNQNNQDQAKTEVDDDTEVLAEELGSLVFESALMQYLAETEDEEEKLFEDYVDANAGSDDLIEELCTRFPKFKEILETEMAVMQADINEITSDEN